MKCINCNTQMEAREFLTKDKEIIGTVFNCRTCNRAGAATRSTRKIRCSACGHSGPVGQACNC
jgi:DNA-directed RNA polymerase subunit RPC12/RpoP